MNALQNIADRQKLLTQTQDQGTAAVHSQWRKGLKGRPVCISNGLLWNIEAPSGLAFSCLVDLPIDDLKAGQNTSGCSDLLSI